MGGWDTSESIADMPANRAVFLDNWFPETDKVTVRRGSEVHSTGLTGMVETLIEYTALSGAGKLFAANNGSIYEVTSGGAVGSAVSTGHTNNRWQYVNMGTAGGQFARLVNGTDTPLLYNGSTWATTAITGPTAANLVWCNVHQRRLWVGEEDSLSAWYLAVNNVSGAATEFPLAGIFRLGGFIMAMGTWTRDAGDGMDDVAVFLTSEGECAIYSGTDPADAALWLLVGVFRIGKPVGRRCFVSAGSDLIIVTQDGFVPLSAILTLDRAQAQRAALSKQISKVVNDAVRLYSGVFGWQPILYPKGVQLIFNIPFSSILSHQYVFNTITGAPCRFIGMDAFCFGLLDDDLYYGGGDGRVYKWDSGSSDNPAGVSQDIVADGSQAFSYFGSEGRNKLFKEVEPMFESSGPPNAAVDLNLDFQILPSQSLAAVSTSGAGEALWGSGKWGVAKWGAGKIVYSGWRGARGTGRAAALRIRVSTSTIRPSWLATNFLFVPGGNM